MSTATATLSPKATPLRRAKYVTVEELVHSQYEIDRTRLVDELAKLRAPADEPAAAGGDRKGPSSLSEVGGSTKAQPNTWETPTQHQHDLHAGSLRSPLHAKHHHNRLQPPRDGFNLCLLVGKFEVVVDKYRVDGSRILVAEVEIGDDSGSISLRARDDQIDLLREVSNKQGAIVLRNCTVELYQGKHLRLGVSKWGKMSVYPDGIESTPSPPSRINRELNFSLVNLNFVATAKVPNDPPVPVATVHHKQQKNIQRVDDSLQRGSPYNRGRAQGDAYQKKKKNEFQPHQHGYGSNINASNASYSPRHQRIIGGVPSPQNLHAPQIYQQYSDAGSLYSYPSQHHDSSRQMLPNTQYSSQQHFIYQQFHDLQQRHAHQMILLQQQHESQFRDLEQAAAQTSIIPDSRVESLEAGAEYPVLTSVGSMGSQFSPGVYQRPPTMQPYLPVPHPNSPHRQPAINLDYHYDSLVASPMSNVFRADEQQTQDTGGVPTDASIISPPMSPAQSSRPPPQAPNQYPDGRQK